MGDALAADDDVFLLGEDVGAAGGAFKTTEGLLERFGAERVLDTPISEQAIVGAAIGAAIKGLRPVAEIMFADFAGVCFDQIANELAKYRYMTGGQVTLPVTIRLANGAGAGFGSQHSQTVENWFLNVPGLKIAVPATPADAYGLLRAAVRDDDPVLYFEHKGLLNHKGELARRTRRRSARARSVVRAGADVTRRRHPADAPRAPRRPRGAGGGGHRRRADRPADARPARHRDDRRQRRADEPARRRAGVAARRQLGRVADRAVVPSASTRSTRRRCWSAATRPRCRTPDRSRQAWLPSAERIADAVRVV